MAGITRVNPGSRFGEFSRDETEQSITERFENQVRNNLHRIAIQTRRVQLTYDDLNKSANRLARLLLQQSRDDRPVAILMEHAAPAVIAILGALKASKIFILLDPALPGARIGQILDDSGSNLIVTNEQNLGIAKDLLKEGRRLVNADRCDTVLDASNVNLEIPPDSISYILYTSGSTGRPKGVMRTHRNDLHNIRNRTNSFCISGDDRITLLGSFSTGQGMTDIYSALLNGATLFPRNLKREGLQGLADWLILERMTIYHSSATFFRRFVGELSSDVVFPDLRIVNVGGEPVTWKDVELYKDHFSDDCVLVNELSCSEASTFAQFFVNKETEIHLTVPVGYPVEDKDVLILDDRGNPLKTGAGEIAICSRFLSPGYWNQPDLTNLAFSLDRKFQGVRIYRTGDLGRKSADGCLEYLGRKDTRVKIRGYRVECYEIELALLQNPTVHQAFVTHRQDTRNETHLIAYIVCADRTRPTLGELRANLGQRLPSHMIPAAFVFLDALPLTATGKIDREALPEPDSIRPPLDTSYVSPRDPIEKSVADICSEILNIGALGVHDNLFDLGGHSLSAMQIIAKLMKTFRVNVPLQRFYESPTVAALSIMIATSRGSVEASETTASSQDVPVDHVPLSYFQERLWFMEQWDPGKPTYNICHAYRLEGPLDAQALEESLNAVIARHQILRASFSTDNDNPSQAIVAALRLRIAIEDLRTVRETERYAAGMRLAEEEARQAFDLGRPLLRALLIQLADKEHLLLLTIHQLVCDGWSIRILFSEFWTAYQAISRNETPSLPPLLAQYSDFAVWQRQLLNDSRVQSHVAYWHKTLCGTLPPLGLPTDYPRPAVESFRGSKVLLTLSEPLTESLNALSRRKEVSLFVTLMATFKILLYRYSGQNDLIVGFPIANRSWGETIGLVGFFVNTLVARATISGKLTFKDFLFRVRDVCHAAYEHSDLPFEKLVEYLQPPRDLSRNPIFQAMFTFHNMPVTYALPAELRSSPISIDNGTSKVDLNLSLAERDSKLTGFFEYSRDLFDRDRIERLAGHFEILSKAIINDPDQLIATLPILSDAERQQILMDWNNTNANYPKDKFIHQLFEARVECTPDAMALEFENNEITYQELNRRANQMAHHLIGLGMGPEKVIGICVDRSLEMVVGLLGILKAGAAYVPLDPSYPKERIQFMLQDAQLAVLLTQENLVKDRRLIIEESGSGFSIPDARLTVICLDRDWPIIEKCSGENLNVAPSSQSLAYVIYTSGSSGQPKGVQVSHRSVVNCLSSIGKEIELTPQDVWLALTSISFDIAALEVFLPLITGAKVVLASREESLDARELSTRLKSCGATIMQATPTRWNILLDAGWEGSPEFKILCGGEALLRRLADRLLQSASLVWNLYGPTETTIWSMMYRVETGEGPVYIGRPIANTNIYILDSYMQPVPIGVHGDLYIGGDGVARGYLNLPELTAERFIANPFSDDPSARLYKTGDRARYRTDGNIEFLGRNDNQVKIRGHRIELGEIEAALSQDPMIKECVAVASSLPSSRWGTTEVGVISSTHITYGEAPLSRPFPIEGEGVSDSDRCLIAYYVPITSGISTSELRRFLKQRLPEYMIPSVFVELGALPLTPNGKIDHNALPPPYGARPETDRRFVEPRNQLEELVAQVWREVLKRDGVGVYDNFFDLGGHSLLAARVVARLRVNFDIDLPLRKLFELPTVAELSEHIELLRRSGSGVHVSPIVPTPRDRAIPLSCSQQRLWFLRQLDRDSTAYNISSVFRICGSLNVELLEWAINAAIARHEILRTIFVEKDGSPVQVILESLRIAIGVIDLSALIESYLLEKVSELALAEARRPFDLAGGPLVRATIVSLPEAEFYLLLNADHMILDGASMPVFYNEISANYATLVAGQTANLRPLAVQYADYAVWQHERLRDRSLDPQLEYWKQQFSHGSPQTEFPADHGRPAVQTSRGSRLTKTLSAELTSGLKELSRREGVTLFITLLSAFDIVLLRHTAFEDVVVGSTIAGRNRPETENLIGFFINALPLRMDLSGDPSFVDLLKRVREVCLEAYTHQDVPFEKIVEAVNPPRDLSRNPLFQILFNVADVSERVLPLVGCEVTRQQLFAPEAKFDLTLYAPEKDGAIELAIIYNLDLFNRDRIGSILDQYAHLLEQITVEPEKAIGEYNLLTTAAKSVLPNPLAPLSGEWKGAIHELLSRIAEKTPERSAVGAAVGSWTYGELERASNRLANYLIANGINAKDRVAIYAHRDATLVMALLAVLKSGGVFIILDPAYPADRLVSYLRIAQPKAWIQLQGAGEPADEIRRYLETGEICCRCIVPKSKVQISEQLQDFSESQPAVIVGANDPAYIAFTSGSTGEPKAVLSRHGAITHFLPWQNQAFGLDAGDRFALLSGLAYNHLHRDVFTPLAMGASLFIPPAEIAREPEPLIEWLRANGISVLHLTPALGQLLLTAAAQPLPEVRRVFFGGDVLTRGEVARIRELAPNATIGCFYGATETQRAVGYYEIPADFVTNDADANRPIPLGRGIQDVQLLVLNKNRALAGIGELGELYVRSPHLAEGYLNDDERTREIFTANPFTDDAEDRLYKTGELARYLPEGNVEWAGRNDRHVNIRGFRVELEEIEAVLKQHPAVKDAAVIMQDFEVPSLKASRPETRDSRPGSCLVAYVAADEDQRSFTDLLHGYLSTRLPDYMIPAQFLLLQQLPLNPNGKVHYQALPRVHEILSELPSLSFAPQSEIEAKLCDIFAEVLHRDHVGVHENFFRLGGHSLLAAQAAARIKEAFEVGLELRTFLESPTVKALAKEIELRIKPADTTPGTEDTDREEIEL